MKHSLQCENCGKVTITDQRLVRGRPVEQWWHDVGRHCHDCRADAMGEPREGHTHHSTRDTEIKTDEYIAPISGRLRQQVYDLLRNYTEGLTDDEGGSLIGGDRLTFGRRRQELVDDGIAIDSGLRRLTPRGRKAIVWVLRERL